MSLYRLVLNGTLLGLVVGGSLSLMMEVRVAGVLGVMVVLGAEPIALDQQPARVWCRVAGGS